eukprot:CAMPEP_0198698346 /NCGR_PEP_ID=MMETSP1468-20131203/336047_1 /TAXON_ID=1461545 /ORGANISM="Mantoniella sp, Strain CCMP1436" /LENGTH=111 /DNA_ID=CAMNT_0044455361 /DNA_START=269 /DNA_END=604 /DNA_ORIENTATION=-
MACDETPTHEGLVRICLTQTSSSLACTIRNVPRPASNLNAACVPGNAAGSTALKCVRDPEVPAVPLPSENSRGIHGQSGAPEMAPTLPVCSCALALFAPVIPASAPGLTPV